VIVVANSGPLMALGKLGLLELLPRLYGQVRLPTAVYTEVVVRGVKGVIRMPSLCRWWSSAGSWSLSRSVISRWHPTSPLYLL
jgi:hypothetical protein